MSIFNEFFKKEKPVFTGSRFGFGGGAGGGSSDPGAAFSASGGTKSTDGDYTFHYFTTSTPAPERNFTLDGSDVECDVLVVAGGGGGAGGGGAGGYGGGGGGAGGVVMNRVTLTDGTQYTVTIGAGGAAGPTSDDGGDGGSSTFGPGSPLPFQGNGGGGGMENRNPTNPGGSGGGGGSSSGGMGTGGDRSPGTVPSGGVALGTMGARGVTPADPYMGGGGGGATASGGPGGDTNLWPFYPRIGTGGRGLGRTQGWYLLPTSFAASGDFGGGGAGAGWSDTGPGSDPAEIAAYEGGGTARRGTPLQLAGAGTASSGGGGGGGSAPGTPADAQKGGAGGTGFVVVRYKTSSTTVYPAPSSRTFADVSGPGSNHVEITDSGRQYNVFVGPGTLTVNSPGEAYYLVVAGGASGSGNGGGGGAGGVRCNDPAAPLLYAKGVPFTLPSSPQTITVGSGGAGGPYPFAGNNGGNSSIGSLVVANGGGRGGSEGTSSPFGTNGGHAGGCGGGGGYPDGMGALADLAPSSPDPNVNVVRFQGFPGHASEVPGHYGGGGGSGDSGGHQDGSNAGPPGIGGDAAAFPGFPAPVLGPAIPAPERADWNTAVGPQGYFAGGGGGGDQNGGPAHPGGRGGGGNGGTSPGNGTPARHYTGGGGGGSAGGGGVSGDGAVGIVIIVTEV